MAGPVPKGSSPLSTFANNSAIRDQAIQDIAHSQMVETMKTSSVARATISAIGTTLNWQNIMSPIN
jgi:hypothetical protein